MPVPLPVEVDEIAQRLGRGRTSLLPILQELHVRHGFVGGAAIDAVASVLGLHRVEVEDTLSFYAFFARAAEGTYRIRLSKTPISVMKGAREVAAALEEAAGAAFGSTSADGLFTLSWTSDIGMADQEPAALVNGSVFTHLDPDAARALVQRLRDGRARTLPAFPGWAAGGGAVEESGVRSNVVHPGPVLFAPSARGAGLRAALAKSPEDAVAEVSAAKLRGRGGAGFFTGLKWRLTRQSQGAQAALVCNADEGEPGTFKDRVLLTEVPDLVFEGMTIAGYAIGAKRGLMYLRAEYAYLWSHLQAVLERRRRDGLLGERICGREDFSFEIGIALGAGAYVCGEESALLESLEGKRGAPRDRPPFPTESGYLHQPTSVNNVETLACVPRIMERGAAWFASLGTAESTGTKLMSVSGDCLRPGVYEVEFGTTLNDLLDLAGGSDAEAVQVSGAAGQCVAPKDYGRRLCYEDLSTAGSTMVFGPQRDVLSIVRQFAEFFREESCGWCTPCRVGTVLMEQKLDKIASGRAARPDLDDLRKLATMVGRFSRCGLGQSAPNPILSTLRDFPQAYEEKLGPEPFAPLIDLTQALAPSMAIQRFDRPPEAGER